jgi:hypothetical protein
MTIVASQSRRVRGEYRTKLHTATNTTEGSDRQALESCESIDVVGVIWQCVEGVRTGHHLGTPDCCKRPKKHERRSKPYPNDAIKFLLNHQHAFRSFLLISSERASRCSLQHLAAFPDVTERTRKESHQLYQENALKQYLPIRKCLIGRLSPSQCSQVLLDLRMSFRHSVAVLDKADTRTFATPSSYSISNI